MFRFSVKISFFCLLNAMVIFGGCQKSIEDKLFNPDGNACTDTGLPSGTFLSYTVSHLPNLDSHFINVGPETPSTGSDKLAGFRMEVQQEVTKKGTDEYFVIDIELHLVTLGSTTITKEFVPLFIRYSEDQDWWQYYFYVNRQKDSTHQLPYPDQRIDGTFIEVDGKEILDLAFALWKQLKGNPNCQTLDPALVARINTVLQQRLPAIAHTLMVD